MQYFKSFKIFEANDTNSPPPSYEETFTFRNTFNYNKTAVNESFEKTMQEAITKLDTFMKNENKDNRVDVVQINANGFASWVPTKYKGTTYAIKNNQVLAEDRAKSIADEVKKRIQKYFTDKGIKDIKYSNSEIKGSIDYKNSKELFSKFIKEKFKADTLIAELKKQGIKSMKFVKDASKVEKPESWMNVNQYASQYADNTITVNVEDKNAQQIYDALINTPIYVLGTSHLNGVETMYRDNTQYATVEILINEPSERPKEEPETKEELPTLKSIQFEKDVDTPTADGENSIKILIDYLNKTPIENIKNLILIGHAEGDDELGKKVFDVKNEAPLKDKANKETNMSEKELANLRFVLSIARCKKVYRAIQNLKIVPELIKKKAIWLLPAGTVFGDVLPEQKVVQVVVITSKDNVINTEPSVNFGNDFKGSPILAKINQNVSALGYNFSKFIPKVLGEKTFADPVPEHLKLAKDPVALQNWTNQFV